MTKYYDVALCRRCFRRSRNSIYKHPRMLKPHLEPNSEMVKRARREIVSPAIRPAVLLRLLAGATYLDMISVYNTPKSTLYQVFKDTGDAIISVLCLPGLPKSETELRQSAKAFAVSWKPGSPLSGCVGALDRIAIKIWGPKLIWIGRHSSAESITTLSQYRPLLMQAIFCFSSRRVGSTHNSWAHAVSSRGEYLKASLLPYAFRNAGMKHISAHSL